MSKWHSASTRRYGVQQRRFWGWFTRWRTSRAQPDSAARRLQRYHAIVENFNRPNAVARFARIAQAMGVKRAVCRDEAASPEAINAIRTLSKRVIQKVSASWASQRISKAGWIEEEALADPCAPCNPRTASRDEVRELYTERASRKAFVMQVNADAHEVSASS